jgi:hypothetical protein
MAVLLLCLFVLLDTADCVQVGGHGIGELGRCRRGWRDGDQTGGIPAED